MSMLRLRSSDYPFQGAAVAGQAARLLALVEAIGLWEPREIVSVLDRRVFGEALQALGRAGVAGSACVEWDAYAEKPDEDFAKWLGSLRDAILASPVPDVELPKLDALFGNDRLAQLLKIGSSSLRRYVAHEREVPDDVADRAHVLSRIVGDLAGSYNERGIRRWFERPRARFRGRSPGEVLQSGWDCDQRAIEEVAELAAQLVS